MSQRAHVPNDALNRVASTPQQRAAMLESIVLGAGSSRAHIDALFAGEVDPNNTDLAILTLRLPISRAAIDAALRKDAAAAAAAPHFTYPATAE